jgi:hypothetical protein
LVLSLPISPQRLTADAGKPGGKEAIPLARAVQLDKSLRPGGGQQVERQIRESLTHAGYGRDGIGQ